MTDQQQPPAVSPVDQVAQWAADMTADGLEPSPLVVQLGNGNPAVRLHLAFAADMDAAARERFVKRLYDAIDHL